MYKILMSSGFSRVIWGTPVDPGLEKERLGWFASSVVTTAVEWMNEWIHEWKYWQMWAYLYCPVLTFLCVAPVVPQGGAVWHLWGDRHRWKRSAQSGGVQFLWAEDQWREMWQRCLGCLQRSSFSLWHWRTGWPLLHWCKNEWVVKWSICFVGRAENFDMRKNQLTRQGFMELNLMEATEKDGDPADLWVTLEAMGYNRMLDLVDVRINFCSHWKQPLLISQISIILNMSWHDIVLICCN